MATFSKVIFSSSALGEPIQITATASPGVLVHDIVDGYANMDEVWLYASNTSATNIVVTIELGDTNLSSTLEQVVEPNSIALIVPGVPMQGDGKVRVFAGTGNVINVFGWVNRITS